MLKIFFLILIFIGTSFTDSETLQAHHSNNLCRITCTVTVFDAATGTSLGITATAGNIFTSCETAGQKACQKAMQKALDALF